MAYRYVHTGPKSQLGGVHEGFFSFGYHSFTAFLVTTEPAIPPARGIAMATPCSEVSESVIMEAGGWFRGAADECEARLAERKTSGGCVQV